MLANRDRARAALGVPFAVCVAAGRDRVHIWPSAQRAHPACNITRRRVSPPLTTLSHTPLRPHSGPGWCGRPQRRPGDGGRHTSKNRNRHAPPITSETRRHPMRTSRSWVLPYPPRSRPPSETHKSTST
ncbi:hypothetical protein JB92DRAFT_2181010 [Gautieria morchelliformis]|nr:hypothetical protein JB92DRAFT_2181010 [Gautieria morchelliformis]